MRNCKRREIKLKFFIVWETICSGNTSLLCKSLNMTTWRRGFSLRALIGQRAVRRCIESAPDSNNQSASRLPCSRLLALAPLTTPHRRTPDQSALEFCKHEPFKGTARVGTQQFLLFKSLRLFSEVFHDINISLSHRHSFLLFHIVLICRFVR